MPFEWRSCFSPPLSAELNEFMPHVLCMYPVCPAGIKAAASPTTT